MWGKIIAFLFDSVYQVVTWVWIGVSISAFFFFASSKSKSGMIVAGCSLVAAMFVMLALMARKHFWAGDGDKPRARPELYSSGAMMGPLVPGEPETVLVEIKNRGNATARNICLGGGNHVFTKADFAGPLVYKHVPVQVRPDLGPGDEQHTAISKSPQPLSQKQIDQLNSGEVLFFHFAEGEYEDDDGNTHPIDYCWRYNPKSPTVMSMCPEKYWPKKRTDRRGTPSLDHAPKVATGKIESPRAPRRTTSQTVAVESKVTPSIDIKVIRKAEPPKSSGHGSGATPAAIQIDDPYRFIEWTDYKEDYFHDAIWRWEYIPVMGDTPRNIRGICPECRSELADTEKTSASADGNRYALYACPKHPNKRYFIVSGPEPYAGIRTQIREKLRSGEWREVVKRQRQSP